MTRNSDIVFYNGEVFEVPEWAEHIAVNPDGSYIVLYGELERGPGGFWRSNSKYEYILPITNEIRPMRIERKSKPEN